MFKDANKAHLVAEQLTELMWPGHPRWQEFVERLEGVEGCDFKKDEKRQVTWRCKGGNDKSLATVIMQSMGDLDVEGSLTYFEAHHGHCDCEILFNVAPLGRLP